MKIAIAQINTSVGNVDANKDKIIEQICIAKNQEADIIAFCEMTITGTPCYDLSSNEVFVENALFEISEIAEYADGIDLLIGTPLLIDGEAFSGVLHVSHGEIKKEYYKAMVSSVNELGYISGVESACFPEGAELENIVEVRGEKLLLAIGEDINYLNEVDYLKKNHDLSAVINMTAKRYYHDALYNDTTISTDQAMDLGLPIITVNAVGASCDIVFYGGSSVINSRGEAIVNLSVFGEEMALVDTDDIDSYNKIPLKKRTAKGKSRDTHNAIILGIRDYFYKRGFKRACLGLSGGIDSAVVLSLAVEALGAENVDVLLMPSQFSSSHSVDDSLEMVERLGVKQYTLPIEGIYNSFMEQLKSPFGDLPFSLAEENLQSRIRGAMLMAYSNKFGALLLNTTNKSEAAMGYGTLYGDTNGAISILGDLYKGEVYDLARFINEEKEIIPQAIIDKAPSAELRPDQKDSDSLPEYEVLDKILFKMIEGRMSIDDIIAEGFDMKLVKKIEFLLKQNEYKRYQLPPILRLSEVVLGKDRILPF
ncbi:MAG: NAD+ synthase [Rikenellaceae bacterium]